MSHAVTGKAVYGTPIIHIKPLSLTRADGVLIIVPTVNINPTHH